MTIDFSNCRLKPFRHQEEDTIALVNNPWFFITSEMRTGKTKIVIDAAQILFTNGVIDKVLIVSPAPVRDVWRDRDFGEIPKHGWLNIHHRVTEFHAKTRRWERNSSDAVLPPFEWMVTNFEFIRSKNRLAQLLPYCNERTLFVVDESSFVKNWKAQQTKACLSLRRNCGRVVLLNGTPISHSPLDLFAQGNLLHPSILDCPFITLFKARYAEMGPVLSASGRALKTPRGTAIEQITGWKNLDDLQKRFAPVTVRRLQKDCLDLPPKLDPVILTATLSEETWQIYKQKRDQMVVELENGQVSVSQTAAVKVLRLAQITSGFLGGIEDSGLDDDNNADYNESNIDTMASFPTSESDRAIRTEDSEVREQEIDYDLLVSYGSSRTNYRLDDRDILSAVDARPNKAKRYGEATAIGREKLDVILWFLRTRLEADPLLHLVVWCRFRPELFRLLHEVETTFPQFQIGAIHGGQHKRDRQRAMALLHPDTSPRDTPVFVGGTYGTGSFGLNFTAAHTSINCSFDYSLGKFLQSGDRVYGPGQTEPIAYFDVIATGPQGQKTIDHHIVKARRNSEDIATWTVQAWIKALKEE